VPEQVASGNGAVLPSFTKTEKEVLSLIVGGLSNGEISERLTVTENTILFHIKNIYSKAGVFLKKNTRRNLIRWAIKEAGL